MKYRMICIDMDGTLLGKRKRISQISKDVIKKAHDMGIEIVITTGRLYNNAAYFSRLLGVESPVIAANGAIAIDKRTNEIIYEKAIAKEQCMNIMKVLNKHKIPFHFHTTDTIYCNNWVSRIGTKIYMTKQKIYFEDLHVKYYTVRTDEEWEKIFTKENGKIAKCIVAAISKEKIIRVKEDLGKLSEIVFFGSGSRGIEINSAGVSKGKAVKALIDKYGIKREELMCIGDNENDVSMIEFAGFGVAMGNAIEAVKELADYITDTNKNDGVAKAIQKLVLDKA